MNTSQLLSIVRSILKFAGAYLVAHGASKAGAALNAEDTVGAAVALFGVLWSHFQHASDDAPSSAKGPAVRIAIGLAAISALWLAGCSTGSIQVPGRVVSVTERGFGVQVEATTATSQTPKVRLGFFSSTVFIEPVVTQAVYVASVANTFAIDNSATPFAFGVNETMARGDYRAGNTINATNAIASEPAIPR